jgi:hypothetical protein
VTSPNTLKETLKERNNTEIKGSVRAGAGHEQQITKLAYGMASKNAVYSLLGIGLLHTQPYA